MLSQKVILIGDAPANSRDEVVSKRKPKESIWAMSVFKDIHDYSDELNKLAKSVKVHAFYVDEFAKANFCEIASKTGGRSAYLDIHTSKGADLLINLVTEEVLNDIGGSVLVQAYRSKYC